MNSALLEKLCELDASGIPGSPGESAEAWLERAEKIFAASRQLDEELAAGKTVHLFELFEISAADRITPELLNQASEATGKLYGFTLRHIPGFYLKKGIGPLWGGCLVGDPDQYLAVFLLRNSFRDHQKFLCYRREELFIHELCHGARQSLNEPKLEEYFAYQSGSGALRRYFGNCFISDADAWCFLLPILLLPLVEVFQALYRPQLPLWPFWVFALIYPVYLLTRNALSRRLVDKARKNLTAAGISRIEPLLFRSTVAELKTFGSTVPERILPLIAQWAADEPRWAVIEKRFTKKDFSA